MQPSLLYFLLTTYIWVEKTVITKTGIKFLFLERWGYFWKKDVLSGRSELLFRNVPPHAGYTKVYQKG
jgi:hypothetical protein